MCAYAKTQSFVFFHLHGFYFEFEWQVERKCTINVFHVVEDVFLFSLLNAKEKKWNYEFPNECNNSREFMFENCVQLSSDEQCVKTS